MQLPEGTEAAWITIAFFEELAEIWPRLRPHAEDARAAHARAVKLSAGAFEFYTRPLETN